MDLNLGGNFIAIFFLISFVWLLVLTILILREIGLLRGLTKGTKGEDFAKILRKILDKQDLNGKDIERIRGEVVRQEEDGLSHVQKLGLVRFNPFRETGGDHSFSLAVLNGRNSGFVITGLHTRERTRIYLKEIVKGKSDSELSKEEIQAFEKAQKNNIVG